MPADPKTIQARNVTFHYPGSELPALKNISVRVRRGEVLAIVGANGSGKSTLAKLLAGLYVPTTGTVTWDGTDISATDSEQLWRRLAMLPQDFSRWPVTARENITLGQGDQDESSIAAAAAAAGADIVLDSLPDGLNTNLAPSWWGGRDLSGGQWQRIAAARAFYRNAPLLICDEPTSALDPLTEEAVYRRIQALSEGRTVILISHRLGATRSADRIIVLNGGRLLEEGTHHSFPPARRRVRSHVEHPSPRLQRPHTSVLVAQPDRLTLRTARRIQSEQALVWRRYRTGRTACPGRSPWR
ncbi:ATP-binding cassette domain-containing protein [Streptomyces violaceusniger]